MLGYEAACFPIFSLGFECPVLRLRLVLRPRGDLAGLLLFAPCFGTRRALSPLLLPPTCALGSDLICLACDSVAA